MKIILFIILGLAFLGRDALAVEIIKAPKTVYLGESFYVEFEVNNTLKEINVVKLSDSNSLKQEVVLYGKGEKFRVRVPYMFNEKIGYQDLIVEYLEFRDVVKILVKQRKKERKGFLVENFHRDNLGVIRFDIKNLGADDKFFVKLGDEFLEFEIDENKTHTVETYFRDGHIYIESYNYGGKYYEVETLDFEVSRSVKKGVLFKSSAQKTSDMSIYLFCFVLIFLLFFNPKLFK